MLLAALITSAAAYAYPRAPRAHVRRGCVAMHTEAAPRLRLLDSYSNTMQMLLDEIADTESGDRIFFQLYLLEGGASSEKVLAALEHAGASRGVQVSFGLDVSYVSMLSRLTEKTTTLIPRVEQMALAHPGWCECTYGSKPDHSKYALFMRPGGRSCAILGGMNIGDRFQEWHDFTVRLPSPHAEQLEETLRCRPGTSLEPDASDDCIDESSPISVQDASRTAVITPPATAVMALSVGTTVAAAPPAIAYTLATYDPTFLLAVTGTILGSAATATAMCRVSGGAAADGTPFSLSYELRGVSRALLYDRSWVGDLLAPLRPLLTYEGAPYVRGASERLGTAGANQDGHHGSEGGRAEGESSEHGGVRERRFLPSLPDLLGDEVQFVCNRREHDRYEVEPAFRAIFNDERLMHYRLTMAYLGPRWGVELLEMALRRGATVELLLPARANVYAHANLKAAQKLLERNWPTLRIFLCPEMVHAKAVLAQASDGGEAVAFLGSANLVRGSMNLPVWCQLLPYDELNALVRDGPFCEALGQSMSTLFDKSRLLSPDARPVDEASDWYSERSAWMDELWQ